MAPKILSLFNFLYKKIRILAIDSGARVLKYINVNCKAFLPLRGKENVSTRGEKKRPDKISASISVWT